jgi:hypothetical protein
MKALQEKLISLGFENESILFSHKENSKEEYYENLFQSKDGLHTVLFFKLSKEKQELEIKKRISKLFRDIAGKRLFSSITEQSPEYFFLKKLTNSYDLKLDNFLKECIEIYLSEYENSEYLTPDYYFIVDLFCYKNNHSNYRKRFEKINNLKIQKTKEEQIIQSQINIEHKNHLEERRNIFWNTLNKIDQYSKSEEIIEAIGFLLINNFTYTDISRSCEVKIKRLISETEKDSALLKLINHLMEIGDMRNTQYKMTFYKIKNVCFTQDQLEKAFQAKLKNNDPINDIILLQEKYHKEIPKDILENFLHKSLQIGDIVLSQRISKLLNRDIFPVEYEISIPFYKKQVQEGIFLPSKNFEAIVNKFLLATKNSLKEYLFLNFIESFIKEQIIIDNFLLSDVEKTSRDYKDDPTRYFLKRKRNCNYRKLNNILSLIQDNHQELEVIFSESFEIILENFQETIFKNEDILIKLYNILLRMRKDGWCLNSFFERVLFFAEKFINKKENFLDESDILTTKNNLKTFVKNITFLEFLN